MTESRPASVTGQQSAVLHPWGGRGLWFWECPACGQKSALMNETQAHTEAGHHRCEEKVA